MGRESAHPAKLGDGSTPGARIAPHAADKSPIAKLPLDAATRRPIAFNEEGRHGGLPLRGCG